MRRTARSVAGTLLCCTSLLAACGDSSEEAPPAGADAPSAAPAVTSAGAAPAATPTSVAAPAAPGPTSAAPASTLASQVSGVPETPSALRFTAPLVGGGQVDLAGYAGQPVLFWFWAPY